MRNQYCVPGIPGNPRIAVEKASLAPLMGCDQRYSISHGLISGYTAEQRRVSQTKILDLKTSNIGYCEGFTLKRIRLKTGYMTRYITEPKRFT